MGGDYILREIFEDSYEHEVYFNLVNSVDISDLFPSDIEIEFSIRAKRTRLSFPHGHPELVRVTIPINKAQNNARKRSELITQNIYKYSDLVPRIQLSLKNQVAALRKDLINEKERALISRKVRRVRAAGIRQTRAKMAKGNRG